MKTCRILVLNGPNLDMLGLREPEIYGNETLENLENEVRRYGEQRGVAVSCYQSNSEGKLVDAIHAAPGTYDAIVYNPGAHTHYSYALRDAVAAIDIPVVEVHLSNVDEREEFRRISVIAPACVAQVKGLGVGGYCRAIDILCDGKVYEPLGEGYREIAVGKNVIIGYTVALDSAEAGLPERVEGNQGPKAASSPASSMVLFGRSATSAQSTPQIDQAAYATPDSAPSALPRATAGAQVQEETSLDTSASVENATQGAQPAQPASEWSGQHDSANGFAPAAQSAQIDPIVEPGVASSGNPDYAEPAFALATEPEPIGSSTAEPELNTIEPADISATDPEPVGASATEPASAGALATESESDPGKPIDASVSNPEPAGAATIESEPDTTESDGALSVESGPAQESEPVPDPAPATALDPDQPAQPDPLPQASVPAQPQAGDDSSAAAHDVPREIDYTAPFVEAVSAVDAGLLSFERQAHVRHAIERLGIAALLVRDTSNVHWVTAFDNVFDEERAHALLVAGGRAFLHTDSRYAHAIRSVAQRIGSDVVVNDERVSHPQFAYNMLTQNGEAALSGKLGIEDTITYAEFVKMVERFKTDNLAPTTEIVLGLRAVKDAGEIVRLKAAQAVTDAAFAHIVSFMKPGMTERDVQLELEDFMLRHGAEGLSFRSIVATGANGADPHAVPGPTRLEAGQCVVIDFGAKAFGYCADMTRTVFLGRPEGEMARAWNVLRQANERVEAMLKPGVIGADAHQMAEMVLEEGGFGGTMGHGLGHGVGIDVHELPLLNPRNKAPLVEGNVVTVEPGIYIPGRFGMRLEDFGVITSNGFDVFTQSTHDMVII